LKTFSEQRSLVNLRVEITLWPGFGRRAGKTAFSLILERTNHLRWTCGFIALPVFSILAWHGFFEKS